MTFEVLARHEQFSVSVLILLLWVHFDTNIFVFRIEMHEFYPLQYIYLERYNYFYLSTKCLLEKSNIHWQYSISYDFKPDLWPDVRRFILLNLTGVSVGAYSWRRTAQTSILSIYSLH